MIHRASSHFWAYYNRLPIDIQHLADKNFLLLKANPSHPSLQFKKCGRIWSARVGINYRAIASPIDHGFLCVWIGSHAQYDKLLAAAN